MCREAPCSVAMFPICCSLSIFRELVLQLVMDVVQTLYNAAVQTLLLSFYLYFPRFINFLRVIRHYCYPIIVALFKVAYIDTFFFRQCIVGF